MSIWDDDKIVKLTLNLWKKGLSADKIAARLPVVTTRNAVISKLHRLGVLGSTDRGAIHARPSRVHDRASSPRPPKTVFGDWRKGLVCEPVPVVDEPFIPVSERKGTLDLEDRDCRWPIGDPLKADFHFCAKEKVSGLPYCELHARRAFQPPQPRGGMRIAGPNSAAGGQIERGGGQGSQDASTEAHGANLKKLEGVE